MGGATVKRRANTMIMTEIHIVLLLFQRLRMIYTKNTALHCK